MCVVGASRNVGAPIAKLFCEGKATSKLLNVHLNGAHDVCTGLNGCSHCL